jgi:UPF0755 protein
MGRWLGILLLLALLGAGCLYLAVHMVYGPETEIFVEIAPGSGSQQIAAQLEEAGVLRSRWLFDAVRAVKGGRLQAGEYRFNQPASVLEVYARLHRGDVYTVPVVIPEGYNIFEIGAALQTAGLADRDSFVGAAEKNVALIEDLDPRAKSLEGYLYPDTYRFPHKVTAQQILTAMVRRFRQEARGLGMLPPPPGGPTLHELATMASIVEKETAAPEERPLVAGIYYNRLARHIALGADPCVIYAALLAGRYTGVIHRSDLESGSPYNTYQHAGLPPGPIGNPGRESLAAALHPAATDFLYFVSDNRGHHRFSRSLEEHSRNVALYRKTSRQ